MNIHASENGNIINVSVMANFESKEEIEYFIHLIQGEKSIEIHITFLDTRIVPSEVIEALAELQKRKRCKVYVLHRYLYSYLYSLSIRCIYIEKKTMQSQNDSYCLASTLEELNSEEVDCFLKEVHEQYGYDYSQYQIESISRRIKMTMQKENIREFKKFREAVLQNQDIFEHLFLEFSINTTAFFRDPEVYAEIKNKVLPSLASFSHIKIWCVGCSIGKEPYSLAILLHECGMLDKSQIYATDINPYVLEEAKNGLFSMQTIESDIHHYRAANGSKNFIDYFELKGEYMKIRDELKKNILFFQHTLMHSGIFNEFHLIFCRNVFIYFNSDLQQKVLKHFHDALDENGFLVLGKSEGLIQNGGYSYFNKYNETHRIYMRKYS